MWPDRVSNPGPMTYESGALPTALRSLCTDNENGRVASPDIVPIPPQAQMNKIIDVSKLEDWLPNSADSDQNV